MVPGQEPLITLQIQNVHYILKALETVKFKTIAIVMAKNTNQTKKTRASFDLTTDSLIENYETNSVKFKICISQLIVKILLKQ